MTKTTKKVKKVKAYARVLKNICDDLDGLIEFTNSDHSLEIYETEIEAKRYQKKNKGRGREDVHKIVPVTITFTI